VADKRKLCRASEEAVRKPVERIGEQTPCARRAMSGWISRMSELSGSGWRNEEY
jgi:hypothetical protein